MSEDKPETYEEYREYLLVTLDYNFDVVVYEFIKLADKKIEDLARYAQMEHDERIRLEERVKYLEMELEDSKIRIIDLEDEGFMLQERLRDLC